MTANEQIAAAQSRRGAPGNFLWLKGCGLETLPPEDLEFLLLEDNRLTHIPEDIVRIKNLKRINISRNLLTEFPASLLKLSQLSEIDLRHNQIERISDTGVLGDLALEYLDMGNNRLQEIPRFVFAAPRLRVAIFTENQIEGVNLRALRKLRSLEVFLADKNPCFQRLTTGQKSTNLAELCREPQTWIESFLKGSVIERT